MTYDATKLRRAPVQPSRGVPFPTSVAWHFHERAWSQYAACFGRSQSAERIAERGGFSAMELVMFMLGKDPGSGRPTDAEIAAVRAEVEAYDSELTAARADVDRLTRELAEAREPGPSFGITWQLAAEERERSFLAERARADAAEAARASREGELAALREAAWRDDNGLSRCAFCGYGRYTKDSTPERRATDHYVSCVLFTPSAAAEAHDARVRREALEEAIEAAREHAETAAARALTTLDAVTLLQRLRALASRERGQ